MRKLYSKARKLSRAHRRAARAPSYRSQWALRRQSLGKSLLSAKSLSGMNSLRVSQPPHQRFLSQQCASLTRSSPPQRLRNPAFPPRLNAGAFYSEPRPNYVPLVNLPPTNPLPALAARVSGVDVAPLYSRTFRRSPFFFVNLVTLPSPSSLDLLTSTRQFAPRFKHHLFPSANYLKTEIFRKLNRQKSLASARALSFNSPFSARGEQSYSFRSRRDFRIRPTAANPLLGTARGALLGLHRLRLAPTLTGLR